MNNTYYLINYLLAIALIPFAFSAQAGMNDDPLLTSLNVEQFEYRFNDENTVAIAADFWAGYDLKKLHVKTEIERSENITEKAEVQFLYEQAFSPYWNAYAGLRKDFQPNPDRTWIALGINGLAPYFIHTDVSFFIGKYNRTALRLEAEKEIMLTQKLVLTPMLEIDIHGQNDKATQTGSGLSSIESGLRLSYEIRREFSPYLGIHREKSFGNTANYKKQQGHEASDTMLVMGFSFWF